MNEYSANRNLFTFFSANLHKLLPHIPLADHPTYFKQAAHYQRMARDRQHDGSMLKRLAAQGLPPGMLHEPGVVATFHLGAFKLLPRWLITCGLPLTLLVSADIAAREYDRYQAMAKQAGASAPLEILRADDPVVMRKMIRAVQRGNWVVAFLDGIEGIGRSRSGRTNLTVDFLGQRLHVKSGMAELARLARCPMYPLVLPFDERAGEVSIVSHLPAVHCATHERHAAVQQTMQDLYAWLAGWVYRCPAQWERWFYIHHDLAHDSLPDHGALLLQFLPLMTGNHRFLLHRDTYGAYPASPGIYQKLCDFYDRRMLRND